MESHLFSVNGRIRRTTYWSRIIVATVINLLAQYISHVDPSAQILCLIVSIAVAIFSIVQGAKRMHDVGKSGWYILIPVYNLILAFTNSSPGSNDYGENPKEKNPEEYELYDDMFVLLFSLFISSVVYCFFTITGIIKAGTVINSIFIYVFAASSLYFLTWNLGKASHLHHAEL